MSTKRKCSAEDFHEPCERERRACEKSLAAHDADSKWIFILEFAQYFHGKLEHRRFWRIISFILNVAHKYSWKLHSEIRSENSRRKKVLKKSWWKKGGKKRKCKLISFYDKQRSQLAVVLFELLTRSWGWRWLLRMQIAVMKMLCLE